MELSLSLHVIGEIDLLPSMLDEILASTWVGGIQRFPSNMELFSLDVRFYLAIANLDRKTALELKDV